MTTTAGKMMTTGMMQSGDDEDGSVEWGTPDSIYRPADDLYHFTIDMAASHANARAARYCTPDGTFGPNRCTCLQEPPKFTPMPPREGDGEHHEPGCSLNGLLVETEVGPRRLIDYRDGLHFPMEGERIFLNPPWGADIVGFLTRVVDQYLAHRSIFYVIVPARMDTNWFHALVVPWARWTPMKGRPQFIDPMAASRKTERQAAIAGGDMKRAKKLLPRTSPPVGIVKAIYR